MGMFPLQFSTGDEFSQQNDSLAAQLRKHSKVPPNMSWTLLFLLDLISGLCCQPLNVVPSGNNKTQIFHNKSQYEIGIITDKCQTIKSLSQGEMLNSTNSALTDTLYEMSWKGKQFITSNK